MSMRARPVFRIRLFCTFDHSGDEVLEHQDGNGKGMHVGQGFGHRFTTAGQAAKAHGPGNAATTRYTKPRLSQGKWQLHVLR